MNKQDDEVAISTEALTDVVLCHRRKGGSVSRDIMVKESNRKCIVRRHLLWDLVQEHGKICELKERPLV